MMSTGPASDETSPERGRAEMPTAFTQPPFVRATDMLAPPSHINGRKAVWISSSFGSRARFARDALNLSSPNCPSNRNRAKVLRLLHIII